MCCRFNIPLLDRFYEAPSKRLWRRRWFLVFCRQSRRAVSHRRRVLACVLLRVRDAALTLRPLCKPECHRCIFWELKIPLNRRTSANSSGRYRSGQTRYISQFFVWCNVLESYIFLRRLPLRRDVAAETEAAAQRTHIVFVFFFLLSTMIVPLIEVVVPVIEAPDHLL